MSAVSYGAASWADEGHSVVADALSTKTPEQEVEEAFWAADELFARGSYAEAAARFTRALELSQRPEVTGTWREFSPKIAFNIAQSHRRAGQCEAAHMAYASYAGMTDPLPREHAAWYEELLLECPNLQRLPSNLRPTHPLPGSPSPSPTDSDLLQSSDAGGPWRMNVNLPTTTVRDSGREPSPRVWPWAVAGGGVVTFAAATGFWLSGNHQHELARRERLWADAEPYESSARTRWTAAGVLAGAGLVLSGVSVYLFTQSNGADASKTSASVSGLGLRSGGTDLRLVGQF